MIVKDRYEVNGSQATNIGWVNLGGGEYRWFMYGEQEARKRFEDRREMMMLFAQQGWTLLLERLTHTTLHLSKTLALKATFLLSKTEVSLSLMQTLTLWIALLSLMT